ncbi:MAG: hypothetical protein ACJ71P_17305 [Nitrososphaeraceae archaeon]
MSREGTSLINYGSEHLIAKTRGRFLSSSPPIFILCDKCYRCATYFDKTKIPIDNNCLNVALTIIMN